MMIIDVHHAIINKDLLPFNPQIKYTVLENMGYRTNTMNWNIIATNNPVIGLVNSMYQHSDQNKSLVKVDFTAPLG